MAAAKEEALGRDGKLILVLVLAALILVPLFFYAEMIFEGKEPAPPDSVEVRPLGKWALETRETLGATPLWVPFLFSGMPSYGSYIYTPASALNPLDYILQPFAGERGVRYFILMLIGGFSGFAFFRRQGVSTPAAAVAALGFVFTPYIPGAIEAGHSTKLKALMHAPLLLLTIDYFMDRPGPLAAAFLAVAAALMGWANHPQILYYTVMAGVLYGLGRILSDRAKWTAARLGKWAIWLVVTAAVSFCLIAEPTLAVREYAPHSIRGAGESGGVTWDYATAWSFHPRELVTFLFPEFHGLKGATYFGPLSFTQSTHYLGILFLLVAGLGFWRLRDSRSWIWLVVSLVFLLIGFGQHFPILFKPLFLFLPYFSKFRVPAMIYSILPLTLGFLVARGLDSLAQSEGKKVNSRDWTIAAGVAGGIAVIVLLVSLLTKSTGMQDPGWIRANEAAVLPAAQIEMLRSERWDMRIESIVRGMVFVAVLLAIIPIVRMLPRPRGAAVLGVVLLADIIFVGAKFVDFVDRSRVEANLETTPAIEYLKDQPGEFRVLPIDEFGSNRFVAFGISTVGGYQPAKLRLYQDLLENNLMGSPAVLSMLNVRYILAEQDPGVALFKPVRPGIYEFEGAMPRAWFVPTWQSFPSEDAVLRALGSRGFNPVSVALFHEDNAPSIPNTGLTNREVSFETINPHLIRINVGGGDQTALMIVSEIHYEPGWRATIDGEDAPILQANHCLRAIEVPPGEHVVEMHCYSKAFETGRTLNRAGGAAVVLLALVGFLMSRRARRGGDLSGSEPLP